MQLYSQVTPIARLMNSKLEWDIFNSSYVNLRYSVPPETIITIDAKYEANLPGLAYDYYGDMELWRAILAFNGLNDALNDVIAGVQIGLPSLASIEAYFAKSNSNLNPTLTL